MRVLMLGSGSVHSSLTHRLLSFGRELAQRGHHVTIMVPALDKYSDFKPDRPAEIDGVNLVYPYQLHTSSPLINLFPYLLSSAWLILRQPADVIYLYKPTPITITGLLASWFKRTPVVLDMDDLGSEVMAIEGHPRIMVKLVEYCERLAAHTSSAIVAASTFLESIYRHKFPNKPVIRLANGVTAGEFTPQPPRRRPRVVFFGALGRTSIVQPLIEATAILVNQYGHTNLEVEILGDGSCRPELEALAQHAAIASHINFRGWTKLADVASYAHRGDIGVCMMPQERTTAACSNQKVFQYMALGLAPIVSRVGDLPLYIQDGKAGLIVEPGDAAGLAAAIHDLLGQPARRRAFSERGRQLATTAYSWSNLATSLELLLQAQTSQTKASEPTA